MNFLFAARKCGKGLCTRPIPRAAFHSKAAIRRNQKGIPMAKTGKSKVGKHAGKNGTHAAVADADDAELDEDETGLGSLDDDQHEEDGGESDGNAPSDDGNEDDAPSEPKPAKRGGNGGKKKAASESAADGKSEGAYPLAEGFDVFSVPVAELKPNALRTPTDAQVSEMARSIRANGLQNAIVIGTDNTVIAGNTRLAAYKLLNRKMIPCRVAVDPRSGDMIDSKGTTAYLASLTENISRNNMTPVQQGKAYRDALKMGVASDAKDLASKVGVSASVVSRCLAIVDKGSKLLQQAIAEDRVTMDAAAKLVSIAETQGQQDALLATLLDAADGKVTSAKVSRAAPSKPRKGKPGRKPSVAPLSPDALKTAVSGISGKVRREIPQSKGGPGGFSVVLSIEIAHDKETFARFDLGAVVQRAVAKLDDKEVREELENARKRLED